jgi:CubicO group peptidase (beta-lactamase class C family)
MDPAQMQKVRELLAGWVACGDTPSVVALVARRGVIVLHEAFGARRFGDTAPTLKTDSIYPIASATKPLTAAAVMCLVEDGLIGLNRPFVDYVPELDLSEVQGLADAKVADLLCHTAGFDELDLNAFVAAAAKRSPEMPASAPGQHPKISARIRLAAGAPLARRPGEAHLYSNFGYIVLGDIVRRVSGLPLGQFVRLRLFEPLGMCDSYFVLPPALRERRVYRAPGMPGTEPNPFAQGGIDSTEIDEIDHGAGGALSTARDLGVFMQMLLNRGSYGGRRILSAAGVAAMTRSQLAADIPRIMPRISPATGERTDIKLEAGGYGFGLFIYEISRFRPNGSLMSAKAFGHGGYGGVFIWADPEAEVVGIFLSVSPRLERDIPFTDADLFQNAVFAAIAD